MINKLIYAFMILCLFFFQPVNAKENKYTLSINNIKFSEIIHDSSWKWKTSPVKLTKDEIPQELVSHCIVHYKKIEPMYSLDFQNVYRTQDDKYLFFAFTVHPPLKLEVVYVFSRADNDFIGRFYAPWG